jgi:integrase
MDVPARLRPLVGQTSWKHSLGTTDPNLAAKRRAEYIAHYKAEVIRLDAELADADRGSARALIDKGIDAIAVEKRSRDLAIRILLALVFRLVMRPWDEEELRQTSPEYASKLLDNPNPDDPYLENPRYAFDNDEERAAAFAGLSEIEGRGFADGIVLQQVATRVLKRQEWDAVFPVVIGVLGYAGGDLPYPSPLYEVAARHLLDRLTDHRFADWDPRARDALAFLGAAPEPRHVVETVPAPTDLAMALPERKGSKPLSAGLRAWQEIACPRPQSTAEAERAVARFVNIFGDLAVGEITRDHVTEYRDLLSAMPANLNLEAIKRQGRSLREIIETARAGESGYRTLAPASIKKDVGALQAIFGILAAENWIPTNVAAGVRIHGYSKTRKGQKVPRLPFRPGMMQALFDSPLFTGCVGRPDAARAKPGDLIFQDELYWSFLFAATAGPRVEEIGQILLADIEEIDLRRTYGAADEQSCTVIYLTGTGEQQSLKNDGSERCIVIHPRLIEIGFADYVRQRRRSGASRLFELTADANGKWSKELSRRLNRYIDRAVTTDPRYTFHSLRHEWKDRAEESDIDEKMRDTITGHAPATVGRRYGVGASVRKQFAELQKLNLNFIDWDRLKSAAENSR